MTKPLRLTIAAAVIGSSLFLGAAPASATCRPEDKVPCETEFPDLTEACATNLPIPALPVTLGVCDL